MREPATNFKFDVPTFHESRYEATASRFWEGPRDFGAGVRA
jgi:hypothetical protein